jgi:hypothetical protein
MFLRVFESNLVDIVLILIAVYFIFPRLFQIGNSSKKTTKTGPSKSSYQASSEQKKDTKKENDKRGEYIDYEEIK